MRLPQVQLPRSAQALYRVIGNPSVRLSAVLALALVAVWGMHASNASQDADLSSMLEVCAAHLRSPPFYITREPPPNHLETPLHHALVRLSAVLAPALVAIWGMHAPGVTAFPPSLSVEAEPKSRSF